MIHEHQMKRTINLNVFFSMLRVVGRNLYENSIDQLVCMSFRVYFSRAIYLLLL